MTHLEPELFNHSQQRQEQPAPDDLVSQWANMGYTLPKEEVDGSQTHIKGKYKPRTSDLPGIAVAITVIGAWALVFWHAMFLVRLPWDKVGHSTDGSHGQGSSSYLHIAVVFLALEFLYTGLFITTHDAMHGTIAMRHRRLNDFLGWVAISLYAWFDYDMLHRKHWEHHNNTGVVGLDPDFHRGNPGLLPWYLRFMAEYMTIWQFTRIAWWSVFMTLLGVHEANMLLFMTAAPLVSAFRLFYFGTYLPHHPEPGPEAATKEMSWPLSRTSQTSRIVSFFTCYHFDLHWEHHRWPYAAWWDLPKCRELSGRGAAKRWKSVATDSPVPPTAALTTAPAQHR